MPHEKTLNILVLWFTSEAMRCFSMTRHLIESQTKDDASAVRIERAPCDDEVKNLLLEELPLQLQPHFHEAYRGIQRPSCLAPIGGRRSWRCRLLLLRGGS